MEELSLQESFSASISGEISSSVTDLLEVGLDSVMDEGILKDIPFVSTAVSLYKVGNTIIDRHNLKKTAIFIDEINKGIVSEEKRDKYRSKFLSDDKFRKQELEFILVLINRYIDYEKPKMLAKLYLAYLDETIGQKELVMYSEVIDRFLMGDFEKLVSQTTYSTFYNQDADAILRLTAMGLIAEEANNGLFTSDGRGGFAVTSASMESAKKNLRHYKRTDFGDKLVNVLR